MHLLIVFSFLLVHTLVSYEQGYEIFKLHPEFAEFLDHLKKYGLELEHGELHHRFAIFLSNKVYIQGRNSQGLNYTLRMNGFGHMTNGEYREFLQRSSMKPRIKANQVFSPGKNINVQDIDYRDKGFVSRVKDQGECGSCWAFSSTGCLESQMRMKEISREELSEQQLIDCSTQQGNEGCNGGLMEYAFEYGKKNGLMSETIYPYHASDEVCKASEKGVLINVDEIYTIPTGDEKSLASAIFEKGPVSVAIDAGSPDFQFYSSGVYHNEKCSSEELNHGVLAVGLGSDPIDYYIVKNSWGSMWGDEGYIKMARNQNNLCGIATSASFATVKAPKK